MKFSVLLPTRNRLELLSRAIETVRQQDYDDWEIIVSDNFSEEDVEGYIKSLNDLRIKYIRTKQFIPVTENWNNALIYSNGDYIIMLGDDDGLMRGYFSTLAGLIEKFDYPDSIYTNAFLYAYPKVMPEIPNGFLRTYSNRKIFNSTKAPFYLNNNNAKKFAYDALNFKATFDYNMQFFLVSKKFINEMQKYGQFFQSPYPDYYAANAIMLKAKRILVMPQPLVTIGISPKSFGYYYFNDAESEGDEFLNNSPEKEIETRLKKVILPGASMNTSWLMSMETLMLNFGNEFNINVNYSRYRLIQILYIYTSMLIGRKSNNSYHKLREKLSNKEWLLYEVILSSIVGLVAKRYKPKIFQAIQYFVSPYPVIHMPEVYGKFQNILDVYNNVDPADYDATDV